MASHSLPIPLTQIHDRAQARSARRMLPLRAACAVFVAIFVLLLWLQFVLSLQITSTERSVLGRRLVLEKLQRDNAALRLRIAEAESPKVLEQGALAQGFRRQQPLFLVLSPSSPVQDTRGDQANALASSTSARSVTPTGRSLLQELFGQASLMLDTATQR